jgi:alanine-glyoxylate transaminase/serine-glyoxylate transaminase/serine-pyruvate transaminase
VLQAMSTPLVGHLDPAFIEIMQEVQALLRYTFQTANRWTIPVSGTGSAAMEAALANVVEPGDVILVPTNGYFGARWTAWLGGPAAKSCTSTPRGASRWIQPM